MIVYNVPYEAGFKSGVEQFTNLTEAIEFAKTAYGDLYATVSIQILDSNQPIYKKEELLRILRELSTIGLANG